MTVPINQFQMEAETPGVGEVSPVAPPMPESAPGTHFAAGQTPGMSGWSKRFAASVFLALTLVFLVSVLHDPGDRNPYGNYSTICMFKNTTGLPCPGCGLSHSFCEIGKGHLASAVTWNWLGIPTFVFAILVWLKALFVLMRWDGPVHRLDHLASRLRPLRIFAAAFVLYGCGRILYILIYKP